MKSLAPSGVVLVRMGVSISVKSWSVKKFLMNWVVCDLSFRFLAKRGRRRSR